MKKLFAFFCLVLPFQSHAQELTKKIVVDFSKKIGVVKLLHGVNNGPVRLGLNANINGYHKAVQFPFVRLHDPHWPSPDVVDIPLIFPNFHADEADSNNYNFKKTDDYIKPIIENGAKIIYRLGTSIEWRSDYFTHPPSDFKKWARICRNIIRHYNEGWANGFHYNIKYWEIWNEPESKYMWQGTSQQYFELYETAATEIKKYDSTLKVGGPASTSYKSVINIPFLTYCKDKKVPLDFFSWHQYSNNPNSYPFSVNYVRNVLDSFGFRKTENHLNEWNYVPPGDIWDVLDTPGFDSLAYDHGRMKKFQKNTKAWEAMTGSEGAMFSASVLLLLQDSPIDVLNFYSADVGNPLSMFDIYGIPKETYYAFEAFRQFSSFENRVLVEAPKDSSLIIGASYSEDDLEGAILIVNNHKSNVQLQLGLQNFFKDGGIIEVKEFKADMSLYLSKGKKLTQKNKLYNITIPKNSMLLLKLTKEQR